MENDCRRERCNYRELKDVRWDMYVSYGQTTAPIRYVAIRTDSDPAIFVEPPGKLLLQWTRIRRHRRDNDGALVDRSWHGSFYFAPLIWLAILGGLLAAVGIYA